MLDALRIHPGDSVAVALRPLRAGETARGAGFSAAVREDIPAGHKLALRDIAEGELVVKYGCPIGRASRAIEAGEWAHTHNLASTLHGAGSYRYQPDFHELPPGGDAFFSGYRRSDGRVGVRNELWIVPLVGCVNGVARELERRMARELPDGVDGVAAFQHSCGCSQLGDDLLRTQKLLRGLLLHPNAGGVLALGLGCENNRAADMEALLGAHDRSRLRFLLCQDCEDELAEGLAALRELAAGAAACRREPCSVKSLTVGLKCGGSDGFSGLTANPLVGSFADWLLSRGGSAVLTEIPETFGAEELLLRRCRSEDVFRRAASVMSGFREYFLRHGQPVDENPSPGNREGGVTTLAEKSLGCVQKSGSAPLEDVLLYGEQVRVPGLSLLEGPGNDLVSSCALAASGAQLILFTTGRGTPFACPVPTLKLSSGSALAARKRGWIDFDAGRLLTGASRGALTEELAGLVLAAASGEARAKSEALDRSELAVFRDGVTL